MTVAIPEARSVYDGSDTRSQIRGEEERAADDDEVTGDDYASVADGAVLVYDHCDDIGTAGGSALREAYRHADTGDDGAEDDEQDVVRVDVLGIYLEDVFRQHHAPHVHRDG